MIFQRGIHQPGTGYNQWPGTSLEAELENFAWYDQSAGHTSYAVGIKLPNQQGLFDMAGNVAERLL